MNILGVDPSQRHTGLCLLSDGKPQRAFMEVKTDDLPILESAKHLEREIFKFLIGNTVWGSGIVFCMERQLTSGYTAPLQFYMMMVVMSTLERFRYRVEGNYETPKIVLPLPVQLKSYMSKQWGFDTRSKSSIVKSYKESKLVPGRKLPLEGRISSHLVEAHMLVQFAKDVIEGRWMYKLPKETMPLFSWGIINGKYECASNPEEKVGREVQGNTGDISGLLKAEAD